VIETILRYYPELTGQQIERLSVLHDMYRVWNNKINIISRKDIDNFYVHHVLHSLSVAKIINFKAGTEVLDVGTGGGFPGIPLAILFPDSQFSLLDSIEKKIKVVASVASELQLINVYPLRKRVEEEFSRFDFVVSRAVTNFTDFVRMTKKNISSQSHNSLNNGIIYLKGGDLTGELGNYFRVVRIWNICDFFSEPFFETKKIVYLGV
jgi:16S rRNA (guanine527-N7)-methyltransferase